VLAAAEKTIVGTSHADVLRGTARADKIYGKAGNDKLYGNGGNDLLVGGAGTDTIYCGAGRDTVQAESKDVVAPDCEKVDYVDGSGGSTTTTTTPSVPWQVGYYQGTTSQQAPIVFVLSVSSGTSSVSVNYHAGETCDGSRIFAANGTSSAAPVQASGAFDAEFSGSSIRGTVDTAGNATGTMNLNTTLSDGGHCTSGDLTWSAHYVGTTAPPAPPSARDGHYHGTTAQGEVVNFDVVQGGRFVSSFVASVGESCNVPASATLANFDFGSYSILGGVFGGSDSESSGGLAVSLTLHGSFDGSGGVSGTMRLDTSGNLNGLALTCSSGDVSWTAHAQ
jgi:hypothetical protein